MEFKGFSKEAFQLLRENKERNDRQWYHSNKDRIKKLVYEPFYALVKDLAETVEEIDPLIITEPSKCVSRLHRDLRFSKDKVTLYRDHVWLVFKRRTGEDVPAFYFEISPEGYFCGMGSWECSVKKMKMYRRYILRYPEEFREAVKPIKIFKCASVKYSRRFKEQCAPDLDDWYMSKSVHVCFSGLDTDKLFSDKLVAEIKAAYKEASKLYTLLLNMENIPELADEVREEDKYIPINKNKNFEW